MNIKRDNSSNLYYSSEIVESPIDNKYETKFDPIRGGGNSEEIFSIVNCDYAKFSTIKEYGIIDNPKYINDTDLEIIKYLIEGNDVEILKNLTEFESADFLNNLIFGILLEGKYGTLDNYKKIIKQLGNNIDVWSANIDGKKTYFISNYGKASSGYLKDLFNNKSKEDKILDFKTIKDLLKYEEFIILLNDKAKDDIKVIKPLIENISYQVNKDSSVNEKIKKFQIKDLIPNIEVINKETLKITLMEEIRKNEFLSKLFHIKENEKYDDFIERYRNEKITIIPNVRELLPLIKKLLEDSKKKIAFGRKICENRVIEGKYINSSLKLLREDLKSISEIKNKNTIFYSPDFENSCLNDYCPREENCFELKPSDITIKIKSPIFQYIYNYINKQKELPIETFFNEIIISVFCVLNISKQANNPPPVIYIDINQLKYLFQIYKKDNDNKKILIELAKLSEKYADYKIIIDSYIADAKDDSIFRNGINDFIDIIGNVNASTSIGTLEFTDSIAKLNTTDLICFNNDKYVNMQPL
jgi:hypothetical protein